MTRDIYQTSVIFDGNTARNLGTDGINAYSDVFLNSDFRAR
jgi:hypothetical protein